MRSCLPVLLFGAALAPRGQLMVFLQAMGETPALFCTSTNHHEQYE